jgi:hypothetical protein
VDTQFSHIFLNQMRLGMLAFVLVPVSLMMCVAISSVTVSQPEVVAKLAASLSPSNPLEKRSAPWPITPASEMSINNSGVVGEARACEVTNATVNDVPIGAVLSSANESQVQRCWRQVDDTNMRPLVRDYRGFRECFGMCWDSAPFRASEWENRLRRDLDPIMMPMHGGVLPQRMAKLSVELSRLCPTPPVESPHMWVNDTVIVEFGCGNAALLSIVAPRSPHVFGVGTEVAKTLVDHGAAFYPHLAVHRLVLRRARTPSRL